MQKPSPGPWGHTGSSPGAPQPESPGSRVHPQGAQGTGMVTLQCPQAGRGRLGPPPAGPGVMGKAARNRDSARAIQRLSPPAAATAVGTGTSHPRALGKRGCHGGHRVPSGAQHLPDAGVPPGRAPAARQHRPAPVAPVAVARPSPAVAVPAGTASCHPAAPCFPASASHPRWYRRHKAALSLRRPRGVMPASVPGPVPPPLTPLPPQGTAPGDTSPCHGAGAQLTPLASALMTSERCPWPAGGGRGRYK